jgi:glutamate 5-kinase
MEKISLKIGTSVILNERLRVNKEQIFNIAEQIAGFRKKGYFFYIISSGARGFGKAIFKGSSQNLSLLTSVGQIELMKFYKKIFDRFNLKIAQLLLTKDLFTDKGDYENLKNLLKEFSEKDVVPIINENDPLSFGEKSFFENDLLSAIIAIVTNSSKLILLSTVEGVYKLNGSKEVIREIKNIDKEIEKRFCFKTFSQLGRGGMISKLRAARLASLAGIETFIINGLKENSFRKVLLGTKIGTKIIPSKKGLSERGKWMLISSSSGGGKLFVDNGAKEALLKRKSLLAIGIKKVTGQFREEDIVNIYDISGNLFAIGKVNYPFQKLEILNRIREMGEVKKIFQKEVVHSNNLILV